jgi:F-type H+-transporting ATPase subunit epsilon
MANTFQLEIATPERLIMDVQVTEAQWPAKAGYTCVLPGHAPLVSALDSGLLTYMGAAGSRRGVVKLDGGFVEVLNDHVRILADKAEVPSE